MKQNSTLTGRTAFLLVSASVGLTLAILATTFMVAGLSISPMGPAVAEPGPGIEPPALQPAGLPDTVARSAVLTEAQPPADTTDAGAAMESRPSERSRKERESSGARRTVSSQEQTSRGTYASVRAPRERDHHDEDDDD